MPTMGGGVPAVAPAASTAVAAAPAVEAKPEKDNFDVKLVSFGSADNKIKVIKEVRAITGLGLKEVHVLAQLWILFLTLWDCVRHFCMFLRWLRPRSLLKAPPR